MTLITRNSTSAQVLAAFANGGTIDFERNIKIVCSASSHISPPIKANTIINGNGATLEFQMNNATDAANKGKPWIAFKVNNGVTINSLHLKGRMAYEVMGSNITINNCKVDQSSPFPDKYNALASGIYACFLIRYTGSHDITFNACEAWYADHMGFAVWNGGGTFNCYGIKWLNCKAMHCGSGWEWSDGSSPGHNPWGRGFDVLEDHGVVKFVAENCCAYDCLQSGFYNEGEYWSVDAKGNKYFRNSKPQGVFRNCHAENCGIRIAEAAIANRNLIDGIPWPNGVKSGKPDVYGDGFYCLGSGITIENCTSKNNLVGFTIYAATINGFQDEGSWIGGQNSDGKVTNATFVKPKYFAFAWHNKLKSGSSIRIIDPPGNRPPVLGTWFTPQGQRCTHPNSYSKIYVDNNNVLSTKWNGSRYLKLSEHKSDYWGGHPGNTDGLTIQVNKSEYATPSACVRSFRGGTSNTNNISVTYNANMTYTPITGCGGGVADPPPIVTPVCNPGEIDCVNKKKCQTDAMGNVAWVDISVDDPVYVSRCDPDAECIGKETQCVGGREYVCSNGKLIYTGKTCTDTLVPYAGRPELKQGTVTKIYARDFAKGDNGKAYMDTTPGNNLGNSTYRTDTTGVDLVQWDARMVEPESNKTVVAYTETGEWLKYPVKVTTSGTYTITFRASTGVAGSKIIVSIDGGDKTTIDIPVTSADYSVFQSFEGTVVAPYVSDNSTIKVEFIGDMNLLWFTCSWLNNYGGRDPLPTQLPVASFTTDKISGVMPLVVQFTDTSTGNPTVWMWDFGDGSSSSEQNPQHTYTTAGTYLVKLTVTNQSGTTSSPTTSIGVTATGLAPVADFTMDVTEGPPPLTVHFTDTSKNNPTSWYWHFDLSPDNYTFEQNPTAVFTYPNAHHTIRLIVQNAYGSDTKLFNYIVTYTLKPTVDFIANKTSGIYPFTVQFNATSSAPTSTYAWDFGDGNTSTEKDPLHTYAGSGTYTVTLTVTADGQTGNKIRHNYITVAEPVSIPPPPIENPVEMTQLPYNTFVLRDEYGYICYISAEWYDHGGEGKAYHNVLNGTPYTYRRGTDALELLDDSIITSTGEWVEYTISVADSSYYYMRLETKNTDPQARIKADVVDLSDRVMYTLFDMAVPVTGNEFVKYNAKTDIAKKFMFVQSEYTTIRFTFTGNFNFKSVSIMSSDTIEGKVNSASYISPVPNIAILPFTINPYQFDKGGQGISYMDTTEERFIRKPVRDTDVDLITVGFGDSIVETLVTGTVKGEWVQYTINNTTTNEYTDATLDIECSTTEPLSKLQIVFINENDAKTYDEYRQYSNSYIVSPPLTKTFTQVSKLSLPVKIYNGKNIMRIYFDDNISLGQMTFRT